jgi:signal transduction histidine kinase
MGALIDRSLVAVRTEAEAQSHLPVELSDLIEDIEVGAAIEANERGLTLTVSPVERGIVVLIDRHIMAGVVTNLVHNAFKFTRPRGHVWIRTRVTDEQVAIEVEDECGGLPAGTVRELFAPFTQKSHDKSGLGLGLTISKKGVESNGGELHVRDVPGHGCVFSVLLPREQLTAPGPPSAGVPTASTPSGVGRSSR